MGGRGREQAIGRERAKQQQIDLAGVDLGRGQAAPAASTAMSLVAIPSGRCLRSRMPVRWRIQSASQPSDAKSSFVTTLSGTKLPDPITWTPISWLSGVCLSRVAESLIFTALSVSASGFSPGRCDTKFCEAHPILPNRAQAYSTRLDADSSGFARESNSRTRSCGGPSRRSGEHKRWQNRSGRAAGGAVQDRIALLADYADATGFAEAVGNPLGIATRNLHRASEMARVKRHRQAGGKEPHQIVQIAKLVRRDNLQQTLVVDLKVILTPPAPAAMPRIAKFLDIHQGHFQMQPLMRKYSCKVYQLVEQIDERPPLRGSGGDSPPDHPVCRA